MNPHVTRFPYRLAAIDIDDTLVGHDKKIGADNRRAVAELEGAGCEVILASGRRHENMVPYARELGLHGFIVSSQGARAQHLETGEIIHHACVQAGDAVRLVAEGERRGFTVLLWLADGIRANTRSEWVRTYGAESGGDPVEIIDLSTLRTATPEKVVWAGHPTQVAAAEKELLGRLPPGVHAMITNDWYLEFTAHDATKAAGVAAVARRLGIPTSEVLTFGDGNNDVSMLRWAGLGIAMPHGRASAREAAKRVAPEGTPETALARAIDLLLAPKVA